MKVFKMPFLMLCGMMFAALPLAAETETVGEYTWMYRINGDAAEICGHASPSPQGAVTIPSMLGGCPVTRIGDGAFNGCTNLTNVTIPDGVTSIGRWAFFRLGGLASVMIPNTVTNIDVAAFGECANLSSLAIPYSVDRIGRDAFYGCANLFDTNSIPGVILVDGWAVGYNYDGFNVVTDEYGWGSVELDLSGVRGIAGCAFEGCCPQGYFNSDNSTWIEFRVNLGESTRSIGEHAFYGSSWTGFNLSGMHIGNIGEEAFYDCYVYSEGYSSGSSPIIDGFENVEIIDDGAFRGCYGLEDDQGFVVVRGVLHDYHPRDTGDIHVYIPDGVTRIGPYSLSDYYRDGYGYSITSVSFPDSVTSIAHDAFGYLEHVASISIGKGVSSIEEYAFRENGPTITVDAENPYYKTEDGMLKTKDGSQIIYAFAPSFGEAVGMHGAWTTGGGVGWSVEENCAKSGMIGDGQESWIEVPVSGTGVISFRWKSSSEAYRDEIFDYGAFSVDGVEVAMIGGETDWTNVAHLVVGSGDHVVRWTYKKDADGLGGDDCVWLDDVQYMRKVCVSFSGGAGAEGVPPEPMIAGLGEEIVLPDSGSLAKAKHNFAGWRFGDAIWPEGSEFFAGETDVVLAAEWEAKCVKTPIISVAGRFADESTLVTMSCETPGASIYYTLNGTEPTTNSFLYEGAFEISETATINAFAVMDDWFDSGIASVKSIRIPETLSSSLNSSGLAFRTGGAAEWAICLDEAHDGEASSRSGNIEDGQESWIETVVTNSGVVSFWWKVSSEASKKKIYDGICFAVDGAQIPAILVFGGEHSWTNVVYAIESPGQHVLRWTYKKDGQEKMGEDCAWLDEVTWTPTDPLPTLDEQASADDVAAIIGDMSDESLHEKVGSVAAYSAFRAWVDDKGLSHAAVRDAPNAWLSYALDAPGLMAKATPLASEDVVIESIESSVITSGAFDLVVDIAGAEIGTAANLAEALGVEGATELSEAAFSSNGLSVTLQRTADGKAKATVAPDGTPPTFFLRVKVK